MARKIIKSIKFRRSREKRTNYKKRLKLLLSRKTRLVIRKSNDNIIAQLVEYSTEGDKIILSAHSSELRKKGWLLSTSNSAAAYLTGILLGQRAKDKVKDAITDLGFHTSTKGSRIYALVKGVVESGVNIPHSKEILPDDNRVRGKKIEEYAQKLMKDDKAKYDKVFSRYAKANINPADISKHVEEIKNKIIKG